MVKVPHEYMVAIDVLENCLQTWLVDFSESELTEHYPEKVLDALIVGFAMGSQCQYRIAHVAWSVVNEILYDMAVTLLERGAYNEELEESQKILLRHIRKVYEPKTKP